VSGKTLPAYVSNPSETLNREWQVVRNFRRQSAAGTARQHMKAPRWKITLTSSLPIGHGASLSGETSVDGPRVPSSPDLREKKSSAMSMVASGCVFTGTVTIRERGQFMLGQSVAGMGRNGVRQPCHPSRGPGGHRGFSER
jgi:hypothetical protein